MTGTAIGCAALIGAGMFLARAAVPVIMAFRLGRAVERIRRRP